MIICSIYRSFKKDEMYLYVKKTVGLSEIPEALTKLFGKPVHVMDLLLRAEHKLARVNVIDVLNEIEQKGYFLQMPPQKEDYLLDLIKNQPKVAKS